MSTLSVRSLRSYLCFRCMAGSLLLLAPGIGFSASTLAQDDKAESDSSIARQSEEIDDFIYELSTALLNNDSGHLSRLFSVGGMIRMAEKQNKIDGGEELDSAKLSRFLRDTFRDSTGRWPLIFAWNDHAIEKLDFADDGIATVRIRHWFDEFEFYRIWIWTLKRNEDGHWQVVDYRDRDRGIQLSSIVGLAASHLDESPAWLKELAEFFQAVNEFGQAYILEENIDTLQSYIDDLLEEDLPADIHCFLLSTAIDYVQYLEDGEGAMELLEEIQRLEGDYPIAMVHKGEALNLLDDFDESIEVLTEYCQEYGWYADICEIISDVYWNNGNMAKSEELALKGLSDRKTSWGCLASLAVALPENRKSDVDPHLAALDNEEGALEFVIDWAITLEDDIAALHVFSILKRNHPESQLIDYYDEYFDK